MSIYVEVQKNGDKTINLERALKKFKNKVKKAGLMEELADRMYYIKPSLKKKLKSKR